MQVAKKVATWACHRPRKRCRSPKKWRPGRGGPPEKARRLSWQGLGASWVPLEASGVSLGSSWATSWRVLGASWDLLGGSWGVLGTSWGPLGGTFGKISKKINVLDSSWDPNWKPKSKKIDVKKRVLYDMQFFSIFTKFSSILAPQNQPNLILFPFQTQE